MVRRREKPFVRFGLCNVLHLAHVKRASQFHRVLVEAADTLPDSVEDEQPQDRTEEE